MDDRKQHMKNLFHAPLISPKVVETKSPEFKKPTETDEIDDGQTSEYVTINPDLADVEPQMVKTPSQSQHQSQLGQTSSIAALPEPSIESQ
jgi:hypothetical protein